jgi:hypothetical protein
MPVPKVKRLGAIIAPMAVLVAFFAAAAAGSSLHGGPGSQRLLGTAGADAIAGGPGADTLLGRGGADRLDGGGGADLVSGGPGNDRLLLVDGQRDVARCGSGQDVVIATPLDRIAADCERLRIDSKEPVRPAPAPVPASPRPAASSPQAPPPSGGPGRGAEEEAPSEPEEEGPEEESLEERERLGETEPIALFPAGHGWSGNGVGSFGDSGPPFVLSGDRTFKIETDGQEGDSVATSPLLEPVDLTHSHVLLESLISFSAHLGEVRMRLASGNIDTDYAEAGFWKEGSDPIGLDSSFEPQTEPIGAFHVVGDVDWSAIDRVELSVTDDGTGPVSLYVDSIEAVRSSLHPLISFAFDDGLASTYSLAAQPLAAAHFPASAYVIANAVGEPGYMTLGQLDSLQASQWEIGGHALTIADHNQPLGFDSLGPLALEADMSGLRDWLDLHGFPRRTFAYPKGAAGAPVRAATAAGFCAARTTAEGPETIPPRNPYTIRGWSINGLETHLADVEATIDRAVAENAWLILTFHRLVQGQPAAATDFNYEDFKKVVGYVRSLRGKGKPKVETIADAAGC